jgi:hypothetical protein
VCASVLVPSAVFPIAEPNAGPSPVLGDELKAGGFQGLGDDNECCASWGTALALELTNRDDPDACSLSKVCLGPIQEASRGPAL